MSDTSQGPGWWMASDGKWYAPELHPDAVAQRAAAAQAAQAQAATPNAPAAAASTSVARETPDHIVAGPSGGGAKRPARRGSGRRELVLVALLAFLLGGLAGFGASRFLTDDATTREETADSSTNTTRRTTDDTDDRQPREADADPDADGDQAADREAKSSLRRAFSAAKGLATNWQGRWSVDAANTPIDAAALAREDPQLAFAPPGGAAPGVVSVRVESVDSPNSDLWLAGGSRSGAFFCLHATSAGAVFYGTGTTEDDALAKCVAESW